MKYRNETTCMFTGHRKAMDITPEHMKMLAHEIYRLIDMGVTTFLCGGGIGWDSYTAMTIIAAKASHPEAKLVLVLPCCKAEQTRCWEQMHIAMYDVILMHADKVIYISEHYYDGCFRDRNSKMVELSSYCICYLKNDISGTGRTVRMARNQELKIINIADGSVEH